MAVKSGTLLKWSQSRGLWEPRIAVVDPAVLAVHYYRKTKVRVVCGALSGLSLSLLILFLRFLLIQDKKSLGFTAIWGAEVREQDERAAPKGHRGMSIEHPDRKTILLAASSDIGNNKWHTHPLSSISISIIVTHGPLYTCNVMEFPQSGKSGCKQ